MKRLFAAILALLYLSTSIGATIHFHYCMGRLVDWGLKNKAGSICSNCGMETGPEARNKCCKDECKQIKIDNDQKLSENYIPLNEPITEIIPPNTSISILLPFVVQESFTKINGPPPGRNTSLTIFNCVFRI